ncbi:MerR family transcriptional regulator [Metabacillus sp. FJAT-52054]|uniref:MerR family transcriptional regulator n=1 Tax=Metabacillus sediminis TaxID=3117746 RepID=A0ABZ2NF64_9BACI
MSFKLSVGQVSKLYDISIDTLRYYDKIGLLQPEKDPQNGYRYYYVRHLDQLEIILNARSLEISIQDIQRAIDQESIEVYIDLMKRQENIISDRISQLQKLEKKLAETKKGIIEASAHHNSHDFSSLPVFNYEYRFYALNFDWLKDKNHSYYVKLFEEETHYYYAYDLSEPSELRVNDQLILIDAIHKKESEIDSWIKKHQLEAEKITITGMFVKTHFYGNIPDLEQYIKKICAYFSLKETSIYIKEEFYLQKKEQDEYFSEIILNVMD